MNLPDPESSAAPADNGSAVPLEYCFEGFCLDMRALELRDGHGKRVDIPPLAFDLLAHLIRHRERVVAKSELFERLWGDVTVSESSLSQSVWAARRALNDTGGAQRVIKNVRGRGYRFVATLDEDQGPSSRPQLRARACSAPLPRASIIGRRAELSRLSALLADAAAGTPRFCLITGHAGIGKTTLLDGLEPMMAALQGRRVQGRCLQHEGVPPFWPFQQLVRDWIDQVSPEQVAVAAGGTASDVVKLIPELNECVPELRPAIDRAPAEERFYLFDGLTQLITQASADQLLLVTLDDLHWADEPSLLLLTHMASNLTRGRLLLCATYRDDESTPALDRAASALLRAPGAELIELGGLDDGETAELLEAQGRGGLSSEMRARVSSLAGGNPFFIGQLAREIEHGGERSDLKLPKQAMEVVHSRLARVSAPCAMLLQVAAVLGREFRLGDLRRSAELNAVTALELLDEAIAQDVVGEAPGGVGRYRFSHPLLHTAVYEGVPRAHRVALHGAIADAIAAAHCDDPSSRLDEIAYHYHEAASGGRAEEALHYGALAAEHAVQATAFEDAVQHYRRSLEVLGLCDRVDERARCQLLLGLAGALRAIPAPPEEPRPLYAQVVEHARAIGATDLQAEAAMSYAGRGTERMTLYREAGTVDGTEIRQLEEALTALGQESSPARALVSGWLAYSLYNSGQVERRRELALQAVAIARELDDAAVLAEALSMQQAAIRGASELETRVAALDEIIELVGARGPSGLLLDAHGTRAWARFELADLEGAEADIAATVRLSAELQLEPHAAHTFKLTRLFADARFDEMEALRLRVQPAAPPSQARADQLNAIRQSMVRFVQGRAAENLQLLEALAERFPLPIAWHSGLVASYAAVGRTDDAQRELERLATSDFAILPDDHNWISSMSLLGFAAATLDDQQRAARIYDALLPYGERISVVGIAGPSMGPVHQTLGELAGCLGRHDAAIAHLERAVAIEDEMGLNLYAAWGRLAHAEVLLERDDAGDRIDARRLLAEADAFARTRDLGFLHAWSDRLAARADL